MVSLNNLFRKKAQPVLGLDIGSSSIRLVELDKTSTGQWGYAIDTKRVQTNVLVENGGTVVIGGIFTMSEGNDVSKVPLLGDIPIIGNLFKSRKNVAEKREMLVFITPRIMGERAILR